MIDFMKLLFASPEISMFQLSLLLHLDLFCMLLSVIHVLSDEVSTPEALQILCHVWYCFPCYLSMIGGVMFN
jgi:hypothetical protein